jgi:hypothetical protein
VLTKRRIVIKTRQTVWQWAVVAVVVAWWWAGTAVAQQAMDSMRQPCLLDTGLLSRWISFSGQMCVDIG